MTSEAPSLDLGLLANLFAEATPAPWTASRLVHAERGDDLSAQEVGEYVKNSVVKSESESHSMEFLVMLAQKPDGMPADVCHVGNGQTSPANAKLIETLRNHGLQLLSDAVFAAHAKEKAKVMAQAWAEWLATPDYFPSDDLLNAMGEMLEACGVDVPELPEGE